MAIGDPPKINPPVSTEVANTPPEGGGVPITPGSETESARLPDDSIDALHQRPAYAEKSDGNDTKTGVEQAFEEPTSAPREVAALGTLMASLDSDIGGAGLKVIRAAGRASSDRLSASNELLQRIADAYLRALYPGTSLG